MADITVRNATLADAPRILEIYAYYVEHTVITFEYTVPSLEEFEGRMRHTMEKYPYLDIEKDGRIEGYAYAGAFVGRAAYDWAWVAEHARVIVDTRNVLDGVPTAARVVKL